MCSCSGVYATIGEFGGQRSLKRGLKGRSPGVVGGESGGHGRYYGAGEFAVYAAVAFVVADIFGTGVAGTGRGDIRGGGGGLGECTGGEEEGSEEEGDGLHFDGLIGELERCCGFVKVKLRPESTRGVEEYLIRVQKIPNESQLEVAHPMHLQHDITKSPAFYSRV
jgi:hypothetical protein